MKLTHTVLLIFFYYSLFSILNGDPGAANKINLNLVDHAISDSTGATAYTFRPSDFAQDLSVIQNLPIGVFDSGIGGLTVLEAILSSDKFNNENLKPEPDGIPDFQNESFIYLGDSANMPYGNYPSENKENTLREHILKDVVFLMGQRYWSQMDAQTPSLDKPPVKAIVIACNTATAYGLEDIKDALEAWKVPVIVVGVIEAGALGVKSIWNEKQNEAVAVYATVGTCQSGAYRKSVQQVLGRAGYGPAMITQQGSRTLAGTIEGSLTDQTIDQVVQSDVRELLETYQKQLVNETKPKPIGTVILGCTHFPLAQHELDNAFGHWSDWEDADGNQPFRSLIAPERAFVDPASWTARELYYNLAQAGLRKKTPNRETTRFFVSVPHQEGPGELNELGTGFTYDYKYGRNPNNLSIEDTKVVPMQFEQLPGSSQRLIRERLPNVAHAMLGK